MQLPPIPLPSLQRNILILILTWGTETSAGPLNWAFEHRSKKRSFTAINASYCITQSCVFKKLSRNLSCVSIWTFFNLVSRRFKGTLWMSEEHPLSLVEQVTPIIDLMARTSSHFARLRDFVTLKFPPGFPVKIGTWQVLYRHYTFKKHIKLYSHSPLKSVSTSNSLCFPLLQRFPCFMCWMPGLHLGMSTNAVLKRRRTQRQQPHQRPQERMKKQQVGIQPVLPPDMTVY